MFPFAKTISSLRKGELLGLVLLTGGVALLVVTISVAGLTWVVSGLVRLEWGWLDTLVNWLVGMLSGLAGWFMLPPLVILIAGIFQERIIHKVELACYPDRVRKEEPRFWADLRHDLAFTLRALLLNLLILPLYLVGIGFVAAIVLNSYLLGREFFESAAGYHLGKPAARKLGRCHRLAVYGGGLVLTLLTLVPLFNLMTPIVGIVWMVHVYHGLPDEGGNSAAPAGRLF